uniref:hypothetical protein n=1 Tax=Ndongobacter massiliensis TaxID=1871025 RepID=UPI000931CDC7|nr:hypothetical protein [Ndongobacter massiliensis]
MAYKVICAFHDLQDKTDKFPGGREYAIGDIFPATKRDVPKERLESLLSADNLAGIPLIEECKEMQSGRREKSQREEKKNVSEKKTAKGAVK